MNECDRDLKETVELGSHQVTKIQVRHHANFGVLFGLVFFSGEEEIARIGSFTYPNCATTTIDLQEGEKWVGVASSKNNGAMEHFQLITAKMK